MKRSGPLKRKAPMPRGGNQIERRAQLARVSSKRQAENRNRAALPVVDTCEVWAKLVWFGVPAPPCSGPLAWHHRRKASAGGSNVQAANLLRCCQAHNEWIEDNPAEARKCGTVLVVREGDQGYEQLGRRADKAGGRSADGGDPPAGQAH